MTGQQVGHYQILEKLGEGGMGEVYKARDLNLERLVAIKVLPPERCTDETARMRLLREARTASGLNHPGVCTIHEVGETGGQVYIVMELVEGETLRGRIERGKLAVGEVIAIGRQLTDAVAHAHERGVVHRDLKCANVILTPEGRVKVLDFGLAKQKSKVLLEDESTRTAVSLTDPGALVGTLAYMAPEQLQGGAADSRSDVWSVGVMLYELIAGARPFAGRTLYEMMSAVLGHTQLAIPPGTPAGLARIIERCLARDPDKRFQNGGELHSAFDNSDAELTARRARPRPASRKRVRSIAVLPLANLSREPEQEYFVDGMTEALIADLARIQSLKVISRTSIMRFKGTVRSLPEIAAELGVDAVVEGSVLRAGQRVRITAQLIHAASDTHLWAENYERDLQDVLRLQSEVARAIAAEIRAVVTVDEASRLSRAPLVNPEAYEACLKGRFHYSKLSPEQLRMALNYFNQALEKDSNCAAAWAGIARTLMSLGDTGMVSMSETISQAKHAATRAIELDHGLADAHYMLGNIRFLHDWDWEGAEVEFRQALRCNPNDADAQFFYADFLISLKRREEGTRAQERALELDPLSFFFQCFRGWHLVYWRRADEAIEQLEKVLRSEPAFSSAHLGLWGAHFTKRAFGEALADARKFFGILRDDEVAAALGRGFEESGYSRAMSLAAETLAERSARAHVPSFRIARLYAHAGDGQQALRWLEQAYAQRESPMVHLSVGWDWDCVREEGEFKDLLRRMRLPE